MTSSMLRHVLRAAGGSAATHAKYLEYWDGLNETAKRLEWKTLQAFRTEGDVSGMQEYMLCTLT